jgi:hypothetical protein
MLLDPVAILKEAIHFSRTPPDAVALVSRIITRENAEDYLRNAVD